MELFIAEKPSLGLAIAERLGIKSKNDGFIECNGGKVVTWCIGHLLELYSPKDYSEKYISFSLDYLPIVPEKWKSKPSKKTHKQFNIVKKLLANANSVIHAGDPDREGALIVDEVLNYCRYSGAKKRLLINDLNPKAVDKALSNMVAHSKTYGMTKSAAARERMDWLVGINLTRAFTVKSNVQNSVLSVGRVQTAVLAMIVNRDTEIDNFKSKPFFGMTGEFVTKQGAINMKWSEQGAPEDFDNEKRFINKEKIYSLHKNIYCSGNAKVIDVIKEQKITKPPLALSLSELQILCNKKLGYSLSETLDIAQSLYSTHKLTTYPRTDCRYIPTEYLAEAQNTLSVITSDLEYTDILIDLNYKSRAFNDAEITAHHAIIPTGKKIESKLKEKEKNVYKIICDYFIAQFLGDCVSNTVKYKAGFNLENSMFIATGESIEKEGYRSLIDKKEDRILPPLNIDDELILKNLLVDNKKTTPPQRFTDSSIVKAMVNITPYVKDESVKKLLKEIDGIGTEATRANIIETLLKRGYIERTNKKLISTDYGKAFYKCLPDSLASPDITAHLEMKLRQIEQNELDIDEYLKEVTSFVKNIISNLPDVNLPTDSNAITCPECKKHQLNKISLKGKTPFWSCAGYKIDECKAIFKDEKGKPNLKTETVIVCPTCKSKRLNRINKKGKTPFWSCAGYFDKSCFATFNDENGKPLINK